MSDLNTILDGLILAGIIGLLAFHLRTEHRLTKIETILDVYARFIRGKDCKAFRNTEQA